MSTPLQAGDVAPAFTLPDAHDRPVSLQDYRGSNVIVYFYPVASTPGCTTQACDFRDDLGTLQSAGYAVLGISPDPPSALASFSEDQSLTFPLLSDPERSVLTAWGAYGEKQSDGKTVTGVIRSTVVVDAEGTVTLARYNVQATGHVAMLRKELGIGSDG